MKTRVERDHANEYSHRVGPVCYKETKWMYVIGEYAPEENQVMPEFYEYATRAEATQALFKHNADLIMIRRLF